MLVIVFAATGTIVAQLQWQDICIICAYDIMLVFLLDVLKVKTLATRPGCKGCVERASATHVSRLSCAWFASLRAQVGYQAWLKSSGMGAYLEELGRAGKNKREKGSFLVNRCGDLFRCVFFCAACQKPGGDDDDSDDEGDHTSAGREKRKKKKDEAGLNTLADRLTAAARAE